MLVLANRNISLPLDSGETFVLRRGDIRDVPERFCNTPYFRALEREGKVVRPASPRDRDTQKAAGESGEKLEKAVKKRRRDPAEKAGKSE